MWTPISTDRSRIMRRAVTACGGRDAARRRAGRRVRPAKGGALCRHAGGRAARDRLARRRALLAPGHRARGGRGGVRLGLGQHRRRDDRRMDHGRQYAFLGVDGAARHAPPPRSRLSPSALCGGRCERRDAGLCDRAAMIETERLILRRETPADRAALHAMWADPRVMADLGPVKSAEASAAALAKPAGYHDQGLGFWVVAQRVEGAVIGFFGFKPGAPDTPIEGALEIGWML